MVNLGQNQVIKQGQVFKLSQSLATSLKILQLSTPELLDLINEEINNNPLLEKDEANDNYFGNIKYASDSDFDFTTIYSKEKTLREHLIEQIDILGFCQTEYNKAMLMLDSLDEKGYINDYCVENNDLYILYELQKLDPAGIFARNLSECLALQLKDKDIFDNYYSKLLDNLDLIAANNFKELEFILKLNTDKIKQMILEIKKLNPKPASNFDNDNSIFLGPDVYVTKVNNCYEVSLNSAIIPKITIDKSYYHLIKANNNKSINDFYQSGTSLLKAIEQRANNILEVAKHIINVQESYFDFGANYLKPLTLKNVAENIGLHESTISRIVAGKYMSTPSGVLPFKFFFSKSVNNDDNSKQTSNKVIMGLISEFIKNEDETKVLSDDDIVELLKKRNISVARRTVAKYRDLLKIPSSHQRRKLVR